MSIIIKGFDTDGNCLHCFFQSEDTDRCFLTDDDIPLYGKGHPASCPLVQLPEGHGRLIDANKMRESIRRQAGLIKLMGGELAEIAETIEKGFLQEIDNAPTIVPAEGGKDK